MTEPAVVCVVGCGREADRPAVCRGDRASIGRTIDSIVDLSGRPLPGLTDRTTDPGDRVSGGTVDPAAPVNLTVLDLQAACDYRPGPKGPDQIGVIPGQTLFWRIAFDWAPVIGWTVPDWGDPEWLKAAADTACDLYPDIGVSIRLLRRLHGTLEHMVTDHSGTRQLIGRCLGTKSTACGGPVYYHSAAQDSAECDWCSRRWARHTWLHLRETL